jgi:hypothetical protein
VEDSRASLPPVEAQPTEPTDPLPRTPCAKRRAASPVRTVSTPMRNRHSRLSEAEAAAVKIAKEDIECRHTLKDRPHRGAPLGPPACASVSPRPTSARDRGLPEPAAGAPRQVELRLQVAADRERAAGQLLAQRYGLDPAIDPVAPSSEV